MPEEVSPNRPTPAMMPSRVDLPAYFAVAAQRKRRTTSDELGDDEILTQFGTAGFRNHPRYERPETSVSVLRGKLSVAEAVRTVAGREALAGDRVRRFVVGTLRKCGFRVEHSPNGTNPHHVSVTQPKDEECRDWWEDFGRGAFDAAAIEEVGTAGEDGNDD